MCLETWAVLRQLDAHVSACESLPRSVADYTAGLKECFKNKNKYQIYCCDIPLVIYKATKVEELLN